MRKRFLSALLALCMALTLFPATALAAEEENIERRWFGNQLEEGSYEQKFYDALTDSSNLSKIQQGQPVAVKLAEKTFNTASAEIETWVTEQSEKAASAMSHVSDAVAAFDRDYPEIFWTSGVESGAHATQNGTIINGSYSPSAGTYTAEVTITLPIAYSWDTSTDSHRDIAADAAEVNNAVAAIASEIPATAATDADKLRYVHDKLTESNIYNSDALEEDYVDSTPWEALSALADDLSPVCEGYSRAFKLICDELGIECILVSGTGADAGDGTTPGAGDHMWNYVCLDDSWYGVDVTWDDPVVEGNSNVASGHERDKYFLKGSGVFSADHTATGNDFMQSQTKDFAYPKLSEEDYKPSWVFTVTATPPSIKVDGKSQIALDGVDSTNVTYKVDDETLATITSAGELTALKAGTVTVTATKAADAGHKETSETVEIEITAADAPKVELKLDVSFDYSEFIHVGDTITISNFICSAKEKDSGAEVDGTWAIVGTVDTTTVGDTSVTIKFTPSNLSKYEEAETTVEVGVLDAPSDEKQTPTVTAVEPITVTVGTTITKEDIKGTVKNNGGDELAGAWEFVDQIPNAVGGPYNVTVKFIPENPELYNEVEATVIVTIKKADEPTPPPVTQPADLTDVTVNPITVIEGAAISSNSLSGVVKNAAGENVDGKWEFVGAIPAAVGTHSVPVRFVPDDTTAYNPVERTITVTIEAKLAFTNDVDYVRLGGTQTITLKTNAPAGADVTFMSSDPAIATVDANGILTFLGREMGSVKVTASWNGQIAEKYFMVVPQLACDPNDIDSISGITADFVGEDYPNTIKVTVAQTAQFTLNQLFARFFSNTKLNNGTIIVSVGGSKAEYTWDSDNKTATLKSGSVDVVPLDAVLSANTQYVVGFVSADETIVQEFFIERAPETNDETYYISVPGVTGGEVIPGARYAAYGERVTLSVYADKGYEVKNVTVRDIRGREVAVREAGSGKYAFYMPSCRVEVIAEFAKASAEPETAPSSGSAAPDPNDEPFTGLGTPGISGIVLNPASMPFSDVKGQDWYYNYVEYMWKHYLMSGTSGTQFEPNLTTSRAMIWTIMARMSNVRTDVNPGSTWYERGMLWAMEQGITDGTNPMGNITREQLVTMLWRNAGQPSAGGALSQFSDASSVSGYAETAVRWAVGAGILTGENGRINPQGTATRAQVAAMIARYGDKAA